jgi:hypothetical protein
VIEGAVKSRAIKGEGFGERGRARVGFTGGAGALFPVFFMFF